MVGKSAIAWSNSPILEDSISPSSHLFQKHFSRFALNFLKAMFVVFLHIWGYRLQWFRIVTKIKWKGNSIMGPMIEFFNISQTNLSFLNTDYNDTYLLKFKRTLQHQTETAHTRIRFKFEHTLERWCCIESCTEYTTKHNTIRIWAALDWLMLNNGNLKLKDDFKGTWPHRTNFNPAGFH